MNPQSKPTDVVCSLNDKEFHQRRQLVRSALLPHIANLERFENGIILRFIASAELRSDVEDFIDLERACCGFLTFTLSPPGGDLCLTIKGPPEAKETLDLFARTAGEKQRC